MKRVARVALVEDHLAPAIAPGAYPGDQRVHVLRVELAEQRHRLQREAQRRGVRLWAGLAHASSRAPVR